MYAWLVAIGAGGAFALLQYGWRRIHLGPSGAAALSLRWVAVTLIVALLLDAPAGPPRPIPMWVALDVSQSMRRGDSALWRGALYSARAVRAEAGAVPLAGFFAAG